DGSPLAGMDIDYGEFKASQKPSGGNALTDEDYDRVLDWLLELDPAEGVTPPKRGVYTLADRVAKRRNAIDTTLLQATTGMRVSETGTIESEEVIDNRQGGVNVYIPHTKTDVPRTVTILDDRVADRLRSLRDSTAPGEYVIGSPADRSKVWDRYNRNKTLADFYKEMAAELDIPVMEKSFRSHGWRTTLNMIYYYLPDHIRALWFGHSVDVNHSNYRDPKKDLSGVMVDAARSRREAAEKAGEAVEESSDGDRESA
ncbi:MAG: site-specific integrase, partial [Corynebacterium variabile]